MNIIQLKAENVKRLKAVQIRPDGNVVVIAGDNDQGKSSVLDSIMYALAGSKSFPKMPVRKGEEKASVELDLGDLIVKRTFTSAGGTSLIITNKDGLKYPSPQAILDAMVGRLSFDPLEFSRQSPSEQAATLRQLVGLDFSKINLERQKYFDERTLVGREVRSLESRIAALPPAMAGLPETETSTEDILKEQQAAAATNSENQRRRQGASSLLATQGRAEQSHSDLTNNIDFTKREIARLEELLTRQKSEFAASTKQVERAKETATKAAAEADKLVDQDLAVFSIHLRHVEAINKQVREQSQRAGLAEELKVKEARQKALTENIEAADKSKTSQIAATKFPIEGLTVNESGEVLFAGIPFEQAASAGQLRVSVAIGLALNPKLRVLLIRDGSLLDDKSLAALFEMAEKADAQVWLEKVSTAGHVSVVIEDGMVKA